MSGLPSDDPPRLTRISRMQIAESAVRPLLLTPALVLCAGHLHRCRTTLKADSRLPNALCCPVNFGGET